MKAGSSWTNEELAKLKHGIDEGKSSGDIAIDYFKGRRTRSAVCGQAAKNGWRFLSNKVKSFKSHRKQERQTFKISRNYDRSAAEAILELDDRQCRWPIEVDGRFEFCPENRFPGSSYCETHKRVSVAPAQHAGCCAGQKESRMKQIS